MLTIAAGALEATLAIAVHDDADIEPAREWFTVTLQPSATDPPPWGLGTPVAHVAVAEGVCDRTRQVRNALRRSLPCDAVDDADLAAVRTLDVSEYRTRRRYRRRTCCSSMACCGWISRTTS